MEILPRDPRSAHPQSESALVRYGISVFAMVAALLIRIALSPILEYEYPLITLLPAVLFSAWFGGLGPGLLVTFLSAIGAWLFIYTPINTDKQRLGLFLAISILVCLLIEALRRSQAYSDRRFRELVAEISRRTKVESELADARREAERARDILQVTLASIGDAVLTTDSSNHVTFLNKAAEELTGWNRQEAIGRPASEIFEVRSEYSGEPVESPLEKAVEEGMLVELSNGTLLTTRDGRNVPIENSAAPILEAGGRILGGVLVFRDVSLRRQSEAARARTEERLKLALDAGQIGVWDWNILTNRIEWTDLVYKIHGVDHNQFPGAVEDFARLVHPEDRDRVQRAISDSLHDGVPYDIEFRVVHPNGDVHWLATTGTVVRAKSGEPVRMLGATTDVTDRRRAEDQLRQQWHQFDAVLSNTPDMLYLFDPSGRIIYVNRAGLALRNMRLAELVGRTPFDMDYPPELAERLDGQIQLVVRTGQPVHGSTSLSFQGRPPRQYEYQFTPVISIDGEVEAVAASSYDVTDRLNAEQLIREDRERWRHLLLQSPAAIAVFRGAELRLEWVNARFASISGRPMDAFAGRTIGEALPEIAEQGYQIILEKVYRTGKLIEAREAPISLGPGERRQFYIDFVCVPTRDSRGQIDGVYIHASDQTDLVNARKRVEESETRYRFLAESIPQMVWTARMDGTLDYASGQMNSYFGSRPGIPVETDWLAAAHPEDRDAVRSKWHHCIASSEPYEAELRLRRGEDGEWRWFLARALCMPDQVGIPGCWVGTCTDIQAQKESEAALRIANRELEEFSYVASHDLQEPLRMVSIYSQLLLKHIDNRDDQINSYAAFVRNGVLRMDQLIRGLLTFSHLVHADEPPDGSASLDAAAQVAIATLTSRIDETGASITVDPMPMVRGDTRQFTHVFQNLLSNALKYSREGVPPKLRVKAEQRGGEWLIAVHDNGIGFEPASAERIFGLFKRLHKDEYPGTGLGLAICKRIVERYGGRVWAETKPGEGSSFYFTAQNPKPAATSSGFADYAAVPAEPQPSAAPLNGVANQSGRPDQHSSDIP